MRKTLGLGLSLVLASPALAVPVKTKIGGLELSCSSDAKDKDKFNSIMESQDPRMMKFQAKEKDIFLKTFNAIEPATTLKADTVVIWEKGDSAILGFEIGTKFCIAGVYDKANMDRILEKAFGDPS